MRMTGQVLQIDPHGARLDDGKPVVKIVTDADGPYNAVLLEPGTETPAIGQTITFGLVHAWWARPDGSECRVRMVQVVDDRRRWWG